MELGLTEKELDRTHRIGNPKLGNKRPRPIIVKFALTIPEERFLSKKRLKNTGISISERLTKHRMGFLRKAKNKFGFNNVWTFDGRIKYYDEVAKKVKLYLH